MQKSGFYLWVLRIHEAAHRLALRRNFALAHVKHSPYSIPMVTTLPMYDTLFLFFMVIIYLLYNIYLLVEIFHTRAFKFLNCSGYNLVAYKCELAIGGLRSRVYRFLVVTLC